MSHASSQTTQSAVSVGSSEPRLLGSARIDAPHVVVGEEQREGDSSGVSVSDVAISAEANNSAQNETTLAHQLRVQARQLAEHLRAKQEQLDRREAFLNSQTARLEKDSRAARIWISESEADLQSRAARLTEREEEMKRCLARLAKAEKANAEQEGQRKALADAIEKLNAEQAARREEKRRLVEAEDEWREIRHQTEQLHEALRRDRIEFDEERRRVQQLRAAEQRRATAELEKKRRDLACRGEQLDQSRVALTQLREEVRQMHRSALELRLAAEELWAGLAGAAPPAVLTQSLGELRRRLADDYREAKAAIVKQKQELIAIRTDLRQRHRGLAAEKERLEQWLSTQENEIGTRAARLVAREHELDAQQADFRRREEAWEMDRLAYQEEIRRLGHGRVISSTDDQ